MYQKGKKADVVEFKEEMIDNHRILTFRNLNEATAEQESYLIQMERGNKSYTKEKFDKLRKSMSVMYCRQALQGLLRNRSIRCTNSAGKSRHFITISKTRHITIRCTYKIIIKHKA